MSKTSKYIVFAYVTNYILRISKDGFVDDK